MGSETEPAKLLLPYLQRADELQKHEPLVAYYCRLYAMEKGLKIPQKERTKMTNSVLMSLINQLEKDKKTIKLGTEDNLYVEGFASSVFAKADKQDRAGRADLNTAKTFYAASIFFEILNQFNEVQPDIEQKQKYAIWKAAEIRKAIKEGRRPEPGPPGEDKDLPVPTSTSAHSLGRNESFPASYSGTDLPTPHLDSVNRGDAPSRHHTKDLGRNESFPASYSATDLPTPHLDNVNPHGYTQTHASPSSYSSTDYPSSTFQQPPAPSRPHVSAPPPPDYQHYPNDQHSLPQSYHPPENLPPPYSYPNFQTYPSFQDSPLPTLPSHQPSYYNGPDPTYSSQPAPPAPEYPSTKQYDAPPSRNGNQAGSSAPSPAPSPAAYAYDPNYQPPVEKITEAHKSARFAVGALAFDDVPVAVEFLRRSLELLTNPSAESH